MNYSQNLSRFFTVQLSMFVVVIFNSLYILSCLQVVVNNFFIFSLLSFFRGNSDILSRLSLFVNNFFLGNLFCRSSISLGFIRSELLCTSQLCYNTTQLEFCQSEITNQIIFRQFMLYSKIVISCFLFFTQYKKFISHSLRLNCIQCLPDICHPDQLHCILLPYRRKGYFWQNAYFKTEFGCLCHTLFCHAYTTHFPA